MLKHNKNNKGAVLVILIVTFLIVTLLASSAIKYSYIGFKISKSYSELSKREYKAEEPLNIIKAGVQNDCSEIMRTQYDRMLDTYSYTPSSERNNTFKEYYIAELQNKFNNHEKPLKELFKEYLNNANYDINVVDSPNKNGIYINDDIHTEITEKTVEYDDTTETITQYRISNIRINYSNSNGYSATSGADIVIEVPIIFSTKKGQNFYKSGFADYVLVADNAINYDISASTNVRGSIYAGDGGINIGKTSSPIINIKSNYVNTRGDITISNGSDVTIAEYDDDTKCEILANNIRLESLFPDSSLLTKVDIKGISYIADDFEVNIPNAKVKLTGEYIGYGLDDADISNGNIVDTNNNKSSSIILNKTGSLIDLRNLYRVVIAGNSYITPSKSEESATKESIVTDETITTKFMQIMYMVPSACISTHTNPSQYFSGETVTIDYSASLKNGGMNLQNPKYKLLDEPIVLTVPGRNGTTLQYYFLRFSDKKGQQQYTKDYMSFYDEYMNAKALNMFGSPSIIIDDNTSYLVNGNMITYDYNEDNNLELKMIYSQNPDDGRFTTDVNNSIRKANSINSTLKYNETDELTDSLFDTVIYTNNIDNSYTYAYYTLDDYNLVNMPDNIKNNVTNAKSSGNLKYDCIVYTGEIPYTLPSNMTNGLVISYGDVIVNHDFHGLIISKGNININNGCNLSNETVDGDFPLIYLLDENGYMDSSTIQSFFKHYSSGDAIEQKTSELDVVNNVTFDNWVVY